MPHHRTTIRQAVRDLLVAAAIVPVGRVHTTRVLPYRKNDLPALSVYTLDEVIDPTSVESSPRRLTRELQLVIEGWVPPGANLDDSMDDLAVAIEVAMHADPFLGDTVAQSILASTSLSVQEEGDGQMGVVTLTYDVTYETEAPEAPADASLDDFLTADTRTDLAGEQATLDQTRAEIDVRGES